MDSENGCFSRYCRNVSQQRLILYGVIVVSIIVALILIFTLLLTGSSSTPTPDNKPEEFIGRSVLKNVPLIDGYNNLPERLWSKLNGKISAFPFDTDLSKSQSFSGYKTDLPRLKSGMVGCQVWTIQPDCKTQLKDAVAVTISQLDAIVRLNKKFNNQMTIVDSSDQIEETFKQGKIGSILSINGGHSIDNKLSVLRLYYRLGVRYITLTGAKCNTPWSTSYVSSTKKPSELTQFGTSVITEMNRLGMIIDLSESSVEAQKKVLSLSKAPVIFSSSAVKHYVDKQPNIDDEVLKLIKNNKGLVMITFEPTSMQKSEKDTVTLENVVEQINYVTKLIGVDHVGIGSGFGKSDKVTSGLEDSSKYPALFDRLAKSKSEEPKWGKEELEKLAGLNFLRVFREVEKIKDDQNVVEEVIATKELEDFNVAYKTCYSYP